MASLQPKLRKEFNYIPAQGEYYSRCQAQILRYLNWEGIILPQHTMRRGKSLLYANINNLYSLKERLLCAANPLLFLQQLIQHCNFLWENVELTQLWGNNLFFDPEHIFFSDLQARAEEAQFLYLPLFQGKHPEEMTQPFGIMYESGILGFVELLLQYADLDLNAQEKLVEKATTEGIGGIYIWSKENLSTSKDTFTTSNKSEENPPIIRNNPLPLSSEKVEAWTNFCEENKAEHMRVGEEKILPTVIKSDQVKCMQKVIRLSKIQKRLPLLQLLHILVLGFIYLKLGEKILNPLFILLFSILYISNDLQIYLIQKSTNLDVKVNRKDQYKVFKKNEENALRNQIHPQIQNFNRQSVGEIVDTDQLAFLSTSIPGSEGERSEERAYILKNEYILGTDPRRVDYLLPGKCKVEPTAKIQYENHNYYLIAYNQDKVTLNGRKLKPFERYPLPKNSTLRFNKKAYYFYTSV